MDIQDSMSRPIRMSFLIIICNFIGYICLGALYYTYDQKNIDVQDAIERTTIYTATQEEYLHSHRARLVNELYDSSGWQDTIYHSLEEAPLLVTSSEIHDNELHLELMGRSRDFITWFNKVNEYVLACTIHIKWIHTKGNSIVFHCVVVPRVLPSNKEF